MAKKKKKSWKKNLAKAAVGLGLGYAAYKGLGKKGVRNVHETDAITQTPGGKWHPGWGGKKFQPFDPNPPPTQAAKGGRIGKKGGGRIGKQFGGGLNRPVARRDMRSGYYPDDMGMRGGRMYKKGGRVKSMGVAKRGGGVAKK